MRNRPARPARRCAALAWPLAALLLVSACTGASGEASTSAAATDSAGTSSGEVRVLQPGRPGEPADEVDDPAQIVVDDSWNHADVMFMQMMIPHHGQALKMARLAERRGENASVRTLAERIRGAQGPEIMVMAGWLQDRDLEVPRATDDPETFDHAAHGHAGMAGMLTRAEMRRLAASRGRAFDRLFLAGMISHHRGALAMVDEVMPEGVDGRVSELAADVAASQAAEIDRMQDLLRTI